MLSIRDENSNDSPGWYGCQVGDESEGDDAVSAVLEKPARKPRTPRAAHPVSPKTKPRDPDAKEIALSVHGLVKRFGDKIAVAGIDLEIEAGSLFGIVGPNGAGKTTTLSMVTGLLKPDAGSVSVHGTDVWSDPVLAKRKLGVLPDQLRLFDRLTGALPTSRRRSVSKIRSIGSSLTTPPE